MENTFCPKCSTQLIIDNNLIHSNFIKCPNCKISFENPYFSPRERVTAKTNYNQTSSNVKLSSTKQIIYAVISVSIVLAIWISAKSNSHSTSNTSKTENSQHTYIIQPNYLGAISEESLHKCIRIINNHDDEALAQMISYGEVFELPEGKEAFLIDSKFMGAVKIRFKGELDEVWTVPEAIELK